MQNISSSIVHNNPDAVIDNLVEMGRIEDAHYNSSELIDILVQMERSGDRDIVALALDVPYNPHGSHANVLMNFYTQHGNVTAMYAQCKIREPKQKTRFSKTNYSSPLQSMTWQDIFYAFGALALFCLSLFLIRKM